MREIYQIAQEIRGDWKNVDFGAVPYLEAMESLTDMQSMYGQDSASSILSYFLANAGTWRGEVAKRVKMEINLALKAYYKRNESKQIKSILTLLEGSVIKEDNGMRTEIKEVRRTDAIKMIVEVLNHTNSDDVQGYLNQVVNQSMKYGKYKWKVIGDEEMMGEADEKDPCWDGYHKLGMKDKGGKKVPNCVKEGVTQTDGAGNNIFVPAEKHSAIYKMYAEGTPLSTIAAKYKTSEAKIRKIVKEYR